MSKGYKAMCRSHQYNFKQPLAHILDFGCDQQDHLAVLRQVMYAKRTSGVAVDKYKIVDG